MLVTSIAMLDKDRRIHLIPIDRIMMLTIEHSNLKKAGNDQYEFECTLKLLTEGVSHPLEDVIRFSFSSSRKQDQELMSEIVMIQNHIIKNIFDSGLMGEQGVCASDDPSCAVSGISLSTEVKKQMFESLILRQILATHGAIPESVAFEK
ncbi:MAG: hypothetical protein ABFC24_10375 [Methanoregulaceae archaeon]